MSGVFTPAQFEMVAKRLADSGAKLETLKPNRKPQMYDLPAALGGGEIKASHDRPGWAHHRTHRSHAES
jgi:hypothetical protein